MTSQTPPNQRIAVIGAGIAGLGAAWALAQRHQVTLFERESRLGGHAHTVEVDTHAGPLPVDTGFIVYNEKNYPNLVALYARLGVDTQACDMSFGVSLDGGAVEYSGADFRGLFAQRRNSLKPRFWRMLNDIRRFYRSAPGYLESANDNETIGQLLKREGFGEAFLNDHLIPMAAAIWSASKCDIREYPAAAFIRFFDNHGLLSLGQRPRWRTVSGGSQEYVKRLIGSCELQLATGFDVAEVMRHSNHVTLRDECGQERTFDHVVIATHADQALALLAHPGADEAEVLGSFKYSDNVAWLHEDSAFMPQRRAAWSSWNYLHNRADQDHRPLCVSYWMNRLQSLTTDRNLFVTLNPPRLPASNTVHGCYRYEHPVFTCDTSQAQMRSAQVQGQQRTWFCGSYMGHGFHEDALQSGLWVAEQLGAVRPWQDAGAFDRLPMSYALHVPAAAAVVG